MNVTRRPAIFLFLAIAVLSLFLNASWDIWSQALIHVLSLAIFTLFLIQAAWQKKEIVISYNQADVWFFLYLASLSLSYPYSVNQFNTRNELYNQFNYYLFFYLCPLLLAGDRWRDLFLRLLGIVAGFIALLAIWQFWTGESVTGGPLLNTNIASGFFILALPLLISRLAWSVKQKKDAAWYLPESLLILVILAGLLINRSLGAWVSLYFSLLLAVILGWKIYSRRLAVSSLVLTAIVIGYFIAAKLQEPEVFNRLLWWQGAVKMIKDHPLGGVGLGNFGNMYLVYKTAGLNSIYAHNHYLQLWAEIGIFSLLFWLVGIYTILRGKLLQLSAEAPQDQYTGLGLVCAASGLLAYSLIDYSLYIPAIAINWWIVLGLMRSSLPARTRILKIKKYHCLVFVFIIILLGWLSVTPFFASQRYVSGINYLVQKDLAKAKKMLKISLVLDPLNAQAYGFLSDIAKEEGNLSAAVNYLQKAISLDRYFGPFHHNLALLYEAQDKLDQAIAEAELAVACHRQKPLYHYTLSLLYKKTGRSADAEKEYRQWKELLGTTNAQNN
ncbi:MAG: O-antigen ligase family protein [bacterium]|nr:O-antigen ligase family protein [bacterium]MDD5756180.1 O-antigen ligase family protein [bacterium]